MFFLYESIQVFQFRQYDKSFLARVMYMMETFPLSWHLIAVIEINADGIARNIIYSRGSRSVLANGLISKSRHQPTIQHEKPEVQNPFRHAQGSIENWRLFLYQ